MSVDALATLAQTLVWTRFPLQTLQGLGWLGRGEFRVSTMGRDMLIVSAPDAVRKFFHEAPQAGNDELRPFLGEHSPFLLKGTDHHAARRAMHSGLAGSAGLANFAAHLVREIDEGLRQGAEGSPFELFRRAALETMLTICFGQTADVRAVRSSAEGLLKRMTAWALFSHDGTIRDVALLEALDRFRVEIGRAIESAGRYGSEGYVSVRVSQSAAPASLVDEVCTILSAGAEPLAAALAWAVLFVEQTPQVAGELDSSLQRCEAAADQLLGAVCKETLRLMPVVPVVDRVVTTSLEHEGRTLRAGDRIGACSYLTHRRRDIFDDPLIFRPQRFLGVEFSPYQYYPFGGGSHRCLGASLITRLLPQGLSAFRERYCLLGAPVSGRRATLRNVVVVPTTRLGIGPRRTPNARTAAR